MNKLNTLIKKYNLPETLLLISSYPEKGVRYSKQVCAVGGFAKNTIDALQSSIGTYRCIVLTVTIKGKKTWYEDNGTLVLRLLDRSNPLSYLSVLRMLARLNKPRIALIEFEFGSFGGIVNASLLWIILLTLAVMGKKRIVVLHQVIADLGELWGHLGWAISDWRAYLFNPLMHALYRLVYMLSTNVVVTERVFQNRLARIVGGNKGKITTISHGVDTKFVVPDKKVCREKLRIPMDKRVVLYFGYLSWYKGADFFYQVATEQRESDTIFVMAGGLSFTNQKKLHYQHYIEQFYQSPHSSTPTGFVPESDIAYYFGAADVIVLPYRTMMSSSGPLSLAFSFGKPVLLSNRLKPYLETEDFVESLQEAHLAPEDIFFNLDSTELARKLRRAKLQQLSVFSRIMRDKRDYENSSKEYLALMTQLSREYRKLQSLAYVATTKS